MGQVKEISIKNQTFYIFNDMIDIECFHSNLLKIDKKSHKGIYIYYNGYIKTKKIGDYENTHSINPLYLIIHSATEYKNKKQKKNREKYLITNSTGKYKEVFSGIRSEIKTLNDGKGVFYENFFARIGINTDVDLPLNKPLKFPTLSIIIRYVFQEGEKLYPQIYLDECLYEL